MGSVPLIRSYSIATAAVLLCFATSALGMRFAECKAKVEGIVNGSIHNDSTFDLLYHGKIRGFDETSGPRPLMVTYEGCVHACGRGSDVHSAFEAFQILTTWVLPAIALLSQLPYEHLTLHKWKNFEAFLNWVGAPASAFTSTMFNIYQARKAYLLSKKGSEYQKMAYFVLSCINQYQYPMSGDRTIRDQALFYGLFRPLAKDGADGSLEHPTVTQTRALLRDVAFELRRQRHRGVWPTLINLGWFVIAFVISIVTAFDNLGDNTTAHSLALGLLLSWLPTMVTIIIVDRNPIATSRGRELIEHWLYKVNRVLRGPDGPATQAGKVDRLWYSNNCLGSLPDMSYFDIGNFIGHGRRVHYCGVVNAVLPRANSGASMENPQDLADEAFRKALVKRSPSWWIVWIFGAVAVSSSFGMAFMVSFNTPTIGLGCRSLSYIGWFLTSLISWVVQGATFNHQEPHRLVRVAVLVADGLAATCLFLIMYFHVVNVLNRCLCKASSFGTSAFGGYMDFQNEQFYRTSYNVEKIWTAAAVVGPMICFFYVAWALHQWTRPKKFVKEKEESGKPTPAEMTNVWQGRMGRRNVYGMTDLGDCCSDAKSPCLSERHGSVD